MSVTILGALPLGSINIAANASVGIATPLLAQLDLALSGPFGIGAIQSDISAQFQAAVDAQVSIGIQVSDPSESIAALANLLASLQISLPSVSVDLTTALSANIAIAAALAVKLGGISALIEAALSVKLSAVSFFAGLAGSLNAGPVFLLQVSNSAGAGGLAGAGGQIAAQFSAGLSSGFSSISPTEPVYGILLLTKDTSVLASMGAVLKIA